MENHKSILIVEDEDPLRRLFHKRLARRGDHVNSHSNAEDALTAVKKEAYDIILLDLKLPGMDGLELLKKIKTEENNIEVIVITGHGSINSAIAAMKLGAYDYLTKPCKLSELEIVVQKAYEKKSLREDNINLMEAVKQKTPYGKIVGESKKIRDLMRLIKKVASSNSTVLITGETGTGKELVAQTIHWYSLRKDKPFITIHCSAIPDALQESELFGYEKGAFTGAIKRKKGLVEMANNGTLFIDEVGEINASLQIKLLRFLETRKFRHLGGEQELKTDIRLIAATNRDLFDDVKEGRFREDLYYRLKVLSIHLPPLRERREDIPLLVDHFLEKTNAKKRISKGALAELQRHNWPGNIRELSNVIEAAAMLSTKKEIAAQDLPIPRTSKKTEKIKPLDEMEKEHISRVLVYCDGNKSRAAKSLGISLRNLYRKIERYNIQTPKTKPQ